MEDEKIVELYFERSEAAISETQTKYGRYCYAIAYNILYSNEDAEECVNDTYIRAWNTMPPQKPSKLSAFLGAITRNLSLDRYDRIKAKKRSDCTEIALEELGECIPYFDEYSQASNELALKEAIDGFLSTLKKETRIIFMRRYGYLCSVKDIAASFGLSESNVKVTLMRTRMKFKKYLEDHGLVI